MSLIAKKQERAKLVTELNALNTEVNAREGENKGVWRAEDNQRFDNLDNKIVSLGEQIEKEERAKELAAQIAERDHQEAENRGQSIDEKVDKDKRYAEAFYRHMRLGNRISNDDYNVLTDPQYRAQVTTTDSSGGYLTPTTLGDAVTIARANYNPLRSVATIITTMDGGTLNMPTVNDTTIEGEIIGEATAATQTDAAFANIAFGSYTFSSREIKVSNQLLQDAGYDLEGHLSKLLGQRIGRAEATNFTTGNGTTAPQGIVTASTLGVTAASVSAVTYGELVDLEHSIDPDYRDKTVSRPRFVLSDAALKGIKKLVDGDGKPLWNADWKNGTPETILGYEFIINQKMATPATGVISIVFGDISQFVIRDVSGFDVKRLNELYANQNATAFLGFSRADSKLMNAGTNPIKHLIQA